MGASEHWRQPATEAPAPEQLYSKAMLESVELDELSNDQRLVLYKDIVEVMQESLRRREAFQELLRNPSASVIKNSSDNARKPLREFDHQPQTETELAAIHERGLLLSQAAQTVASLGLEGVDIQVQVAGLHEIASRCETLARDIGMHAIAEGKMSQAQLSRILGIAPMTVNRWVKAAQEQQPQDH
jgi:hypothetical protein